VPLMGGVLSSVARRSLSVEVTCHGPAGGGVALPRWMELMQSL